MLGFGLFRNLNFRKRLEVYGTLRNLDQFRTFFSNDELKRLTVFNIDSSEKKLKDLIGQIKPDNVINCIGLIDRKRKGKELNPYHASYIKVNSLFPHLLAENCSKKNIKLIHFSTDCVFKGDKGLYKEHDTPDAIDLYGKSKQIGEVDYGNHLTLRTSLIGHELQTNLSLVDWFLNQKNKINGYENAIFSGIPVTHISDILYDHVLGKDELKGLFHLGVEPINKYKLLKLISQVYSKNIEIKKFKDFHTNKSLDSSKFSNMTGYKAPPWEELINNMFDDYNKNFKNKI